MILTKQQYKKLPEQEQSKFKLYKALFENKFILYNPETGDNVLIDEQGNLR